MAKKQGTQPKPTQKNNSEKGKNKSRPNIQDTNADKALDPTRYGDWENKGRCIDFQRNQVSNNHCKPTLLGTNIS